MFVLFSQPEDKCHFPKIENKQITQEIFSLKQKQNLDITNLDDDDKVDIQIIDHRHQEVCKTNKSDHH